MNPVHQPSELEDVCDDKRCDINSSAGRPKETGITTPGAGMESRRTQRGPDLCGQGHQAQEPELAVIEH